MSEVKSSRPFLVLPIGWEIGGLLVAVSLVIQLVRILTVSAAHGDTPFLSANDRSRWCTIASLTEDGSFIIDRFLDKRDTSGKYRTWYSIDMVRKTEADGSEHYYSSKPPLLSCFYAAVCSPISAIWNRRLSDAPMEVGRTLLIVIQWFPMALFWIAAVIWIHKEVDDSWQRMVLTVFVLFGTFLTTFLNTLNNHLPAAMAFGASLFLLNRLIQNSSNRSTSIGLCLLLGLTASVAAACDLPALAWAALLVPLVAILSSVRQAAWTTVGMIPVGLVFAATNWIAYGDLMPPYFHREALGERVAVAGLVVGNESDGKTGNKGSYEGDYDGILEALRIAKEPVGEIISLRPARRLETWELMTKLLEPSGATKRYALTQENNQWVIHRWNDWYDYPKSYWLPANKRGVDLGEPSVPWYAFHILIGHHGLISLTPFWILSGIGAFAMMRKPDERSQWWISVAITTLTIVCIAFYISRPLIDRNYGGVASGFRWLFWLIPGWIWLLPRGIATTSHTKLGKSFIFVALLISVFSATLPWSNPWQSPFLYSWLTK